MSEDDIPQERPSKSQRKRDMNALQDLGKALVELPEAQLRKIPMDSRLAEAVEIARSLKAHEAKRRQIQYIGRIMRDTDPEPIQEALMKVQSQHLQSNAQFHQVERWRDKLIAEGDKQLDEFIKLYPNSDRQHLRQLMRNAQQMKSGAEKELFRYIREIVI